MTGLEKRLILSDDFYITVDSRNWILNETNRTSTDKDGNTVQLADKELGYYGSLSAALVAFVDWRLMRATAMDQLRDAIAVQQMLDSLRKSIRQLNTGDIVKAMREN